MTTIGSQAPITSSGLTGGELAGIVIGVIAGIVIIGALVYYCACMKKKTDELYDPT